MIGKKRKGGKIKNFPKEIRRISFNIEGISMDFSIMNSTHKEEGEKEEIV
jgi:hypothetical protein